jgi:ferredoxin-type protein NapH
MKLSSLKAALMALPMLLITSFILIARYPSNNLPNILSTAAALLFSNILFFLILYTGKIDRYRAIFFVTFSFAFVFHFMMNMLEARGTLFITDQAEITCHIPFCHIVIPMTIIPLALSQTILFPGSISEGFANISSMFILWLISILTIGRGFCSWGCFYGGLDDCFSRIRKTPVIKKVPENISLLPFAVLLVSAFAGLLLLDCFYCSWLCPMKTVTEFSKPSSLIEILQTLIFVGLFIFLVIILPILTKKRTHCALFCPFGAFQALFSKLSPFCVRIDKEKCIKCFHCVKVCPALAITQEDVLRGTVKSTCMRCAKCVDSCPKKAIAFHIRGIDNSAWARPLFLYSAFLFLSIMSSSFIKGTILRAILFITTGSLS